MILRRAFVLFLTACCLFAVSVEAQVPDDGEIKSEAILELLKKAKAGDARAQGLVAQHYSGGNLVLGCSSEEALKWARLSMAQKHPFGAFIVGLSLADEQGPGKDIAKSNEILKTCVPALKEMAEKGDAPAQSMLAVLYARGAGGLPVNRNEAIKWLTLASGQGSSWGAHNLAVLIGGAGQFGNKESQQMEALYQSAVDQGNLSSHVGLAKIYQEKETAEFSKKAAQLYMAAAEKGEPMAQNNLGHAYLRGDGVDRDYQKALHWFGRAAENGVRLAADNLEWFQEHSSLPLPLQYPEAGRKNSQPVLSLGEVLFAGSAQIRYPQMCFADRVLTELLTRYQCYVAYRSTPYGFPDEDVFRLPVKREIMFPAHVMASALYVPQDERAMKNFEGHVWCYELTDENYSHERRDIIKPYSLDDIPRSIADALAYRINAKPKGDIKSSPADVTGWKFVVAPLTGLNVGRRCKMTVSQHSQFFAPLKAALEARAGAGNISAQNTIDLEKIPDDLRGIISWAISRHGKDEWIIDMHLLDPGTMLYISAASVTAKTDKPEAVDYDLLVSRLLSGISKDVPEMMTGGQLLDREAEMFMSYANSTKLIGSWSIEGGYPGYGNSWVRYVAARACERAYYLNPHDPVTTYMAIWTLSNILRLNTGDSSTFPGGNDFTDNASKLMMEFLKRPNPGWENLKTTDFSRYRFSPNFIIPDVYEAETLLLLKRFDEAIAAATQSYKKHPDDERLAIALARALAARKRSAEASSVINKFKQTYGARTRMAKAELDIATATGDEAKRFEAIQSAVVNDRKVETPQDWEFYLKAIPEQEGPEKAIKSMSNWLSLCKRMIGYPLGAHFMVRLRQAECYEMLGQKEAAVRRAKDVVATAGGGAPGSCRTQAQAMIKRLEAEVGKVDETWKTAADLNIDGSKHTIYLAALGVDVPDRLVTRIGERVAKYMGVKYKVLSAVEEPYPGRDGHDAFYRRVYDGYAVPSDALIMCFVARYRLQGEVSSSAQGNPLILGTASYYKFDDNRSIEVYSEEMAANLIQSFRHSYSQKIRDGRSYPLARERCLNDPCIFSDAPGNWNRDTRFSMCVDCQNEYKEQKFAEINRQLIEHLRQMGVKIEAPNAE